MIAGLMIYDCGSLHLFKALGKGVIDGAIGKWEGVAGDVVEASVAIGLATEPGQMAWLLIYR